MNRSATTIAERGYWQITNPAGIPQLIEQLRRATTIAEPCDCDSLGPITVEITTELPGSLQDVRAFVPLVAMDKRTRDCVVQPIIIREKP